MLNCNTYYIISSFSLGPCHHQYFLHYCPRLLNSSCFTVVSLLIQTLSILALYSLLQLFLNFFFVFSRLFSSESYVSIPFSSLELSRLFSTTRLFSIIVFSRDSSKVGALVGFSSTCFRTFSMSVFVFVTFACVLRRSRVAF